MAYLDALYRRTYERLKEEKNMTAARMLLDILATSTTDMKDGGHIHGCELTEGVKKRLTEMDVPILNTMRERIKKAGVDPEGIYITPDDQWAMYYFEMLDKIYAWGRRRSEDDPPEGRVVIDPPEKYE